MWHTLNAVNILKQSRVSKKCYSQFASGFSMPVPRKLSEIMNVAELKVLEGEEITKKWNDFHIGRGHISSVLTKKEYEKFEYRAKSCPMFVLPVPKPKGYMTIFLQVQPPHLLFTGLDDYRVRGPNASPFFAVSHFLDLSSTKDLVLVRGDVVLASKLSDDEAKGLLRNAHSFFLDDKRFQHVLTFNKNSREFDFKELLREVGVKGG